MSPYCVRHCRVFRRDFLEIGDIEVFLEALTIASACNMSLRKKFLKPETNGLIPTGGYSANRRYSKKALMWLLHMERTDGCHIQHARNWREYKPPEGINPIVSGFKNVLRNTLLHADAIVSASRKTSIFPISRNSRLNTRHA